MIDSSLYAAPEGLPENDEPDLEIDLEVGDESPVDVVENEDGSVDIILAGESESDLESCEFDDNLADYLPEEDLSELSTEMLELVEADIQSRKEWADVFVDGMEVLGLRYEERSEPWEGACGVFSTILSEAAIRFQAESIMESFPAAGPVRTKIMGAVTREKEKAAKRVEADMNYELLEKMPEYRPEHERMLYSLGLAGSALKKVYFDETKKRQVSIYLPAEDVIVPYGASNIEDAERVTHVMRKSKMEMRRLQKTGFYRDVDLGEPESFHSDIEERKAETQGYELNDDDRYTLYEIHTLMNLPGDDEDELPSPYIVTIERATGEVLAVRRNWDDGDEAYCKKNYFVHYTYIPGFGFYGLGLIHIIGGYAKAGTPFIRQLVDAGTLSNLPAMLKTRGLRIKNDDTPIAPAEIRDVDVPSGTLRDNIMPLPYKEPSQVLMGLLGVITEEGRRLGAISDANISDMSANAPVGTTLAILERTLKTMSAVQARVHYAMKQEFKLLKAIIRDHRDDTYDYVPEGADAAARQADYDMVEVIPVSDPNSTTMAQRVVQYQAVIQLAQQAPQIYDLPFLHRQMIEVLGVPNAGKMIPATEDQVPKDPVSENMAVLTGKPVKAFIYQDHDAHIGAHQAFMQDPMIAQTIGQNPMAQQMMAGLQAHIAEHLAFKYRRMVEERMGVMLPKPNEEMPEDLEVQVSQMVAQAGAQILQQNQAKAQQAQAQQQAQDPLVQLQQKEMEIKAGDLERKKAKDATDAQLAEKKLSIEAAKANAGKPQGGGTQEKLAVMQQMHKVQESDRNFKLKEKAHDLNKQKHDLTVAQALQQSRQPVSQPGE